MGQQYLSPQQGRVPILSLWDRQPGGQSSFRTLIFIEGSREQEFSRDTDPRGGGVKWGNNTYHHNRVASQYYASGIGTPGSNLCFGPKSSFLTSPRSPFTLTPNFSRTRVFPGYRPPAQSGYLARLIAYGGEI